MQVTVQSYWVAALGVSPLLNAVKQQKSAVQQCTLPEHQHQCWSLLVHTGGCMEASQYRGLEGIRWFNECRWVE